MSSLPHSIIGGFESKHRGCSIQKVDNGFILTCKINRRVEAHYEGDDGFRVGESVMVFYSIPELMAAVKNYLETGKENLK